MANWVKAADNAAKTRGLPLPASEERGSIAELDELHTFAGQKSRFYLATNVERQTRCFLSFVVTDELSAQSMQKLIDSAPQMTTYCTDGHSVYQELNYRGVGTSLRLASRRRMQLRGTTLS
ncbi:MAG: hypothetical protein NZ693_01480 [Thermoflexales bacterium]|nr:hypothetical protein [Thermoflexales bacterium]